VSLRLCRCFLRLSPPRKPIAAFSFPKPGKSYRHRRTGRSQYSKQFPEARNVLMTTAVRKNGLEDHDLQQVSIARAEDSVKCDLLSEPLSTHLATLT